MQYYKLLFQEKLAYDPYSRYDLESIPENRYLERRQYVSQPMAIFRIFKNKGA